LASERLKDDEHGGEDIVEVRDPVVHEFDVVDPVILDSISVLGWATAICALYGTGFDWILNLAESFILIINGPISRINWLLRQPAPVVEQTVELVEAQYSE